MPQAIKAFYDRKYSEGSEIPRTSKSYALDCVPSGEPLDVLDVGCGSGANSLALAAKGHRLHGVDISDAAIARYRSHGFDGRVADLESGLDYPDASFDIVFCSEVIEHMTCPEVLVADISRVLKPGGTLVLSTPNSAFWPYRLLGILGYTVSELQHPKHFQFYSRRSLLTLLTSAGLQVKDVIGRNIYLILPELPPALDWIPARCGFTQEIRFRTGRHFWHLSNKSKFLSSLLADTLIAVLQKPASSAGKA